MHSPLNPYRFLSISKSRWLGIAAAGSFLWVAGCTSMKTLDAPTGEPQTGKAYTGLHYFLPRGIIDIEGTVNAAKDGYTVTLARHNEADRAKRYRLVQCTSILHEDITTMQLDAQGLLTSELAVSSESKTADVLYNVTTTALNIAKIYAKVSGASPLAKALSGEPDESALDLESFKVSFDPLIPSEIREAKERVRKAGFELSVEVPLGTSGGAKSWAMNEELSITGKLANGGVYYRPLTTVKVRLKCTQKAQLALYQNVPIPDVQSLAVYNLSRGAFIKKETKLTFASGEPTKMVHSKPSEALGVTAIPVKITADILDALPALGTLVYKPKPGPNAEIEAQTARLNAETAAIQAHTNAVNAKRQAEEAANQAEGGGTNDLTASGRAIATAAAAQAFTAASQERAVKIQATDNATKLGTAEQQRDIYKKQLEDASIPPKSAPHKRDEKGNIVED